MLDIAWTELLIIAMVAILVVGPRELPRMLRSIGNFMGMVRRTAGDFQRQFNDALRETELDEVRRGFDSVRKTNPLNKMKDELNPLKQAGDSMRKAVEDPGAPKPGGSAGKPSEASEGGSSESSAGAPSSGNGSGAAPAGKRSVAGNPASGRAGYAEKVSKAAAPTNALGDKPKADRSAKATAKSRAVKAGSGTVE